MKLVLLSQSPRREYILRMLGFDFTQRAPDFDETVPAGMAPADAPEFLARGKALSLPAEDSDTLYLSSDTLVLLEGRILGKPRDADEALAMLGALNGKTHEVVTGVAIAREGRVLGSGRAVSRVTFCLSEPARLLAYSRSGEPLDKAGAYAIQGRGAVLVDRIEGCFYNVMGLPVQLTLSLLKPFLEPRF